MSVFLLWLEIIWIFSYRDIFPLISLSFKTGVVNIFSFIELSFSIFFWNFLAPLLLSKLNKILMTKPKISIVPIGITQEVIIIIAIASKNDISVSSPFLIISDIPLPILEVKFEWY